MSGFWAPSYNCLTYYSCNPEPYNSGEIIFQVLTQNAVDDTLRLEMSGSGALFVYTALDTDSLLTYCRSGTVCLENVPRGRTFYVIMDWPEQWNLEWSFWVQCIGSSALGETCENPIVMPGPFTSTVCTAGYRNDYTGLGGACNSPGHPGADVVYQMCVAPGTTFQAHLSQSCVYYSSMYLFTDCNDPAGSCVAWAGDVVPFPPPDEVTLGWANGTGQPKTVYLAVDNLCGEWFAQGFGGRTRLEVQFTPCPQVGACCIPGVPCQIVGATQCQQMGGTYLGDYTVCQPNPCPAWGACCYASGQCVVNYEDQCGQGGGFWRAGLTCNPMPCLGACCLANGTCQLWPPEYCQQNGGSFQGWSTTCAPNPCQSSDVPEVTVAAPAFLPAVPNPSSGSIELKWVSPASGPVRIEVFDAGGRRVRQLSTAGAPAGPGSVSWDGADERGHRVPPGAYFCRITTTGGSATQGVVILR